jgi:hypothetical protein
MQFTGIHLNLFNIFRMNIGKFSFRDIRSILYTMDKLGIKKTCQPPVADLTSTFVTYDFDGNANQGFIPKGLYIDLYI